MQVSPTIPLADWYQLRVNNAARASRPAPPLYPVRHVGSFERKEGVLLLGQNNFAPASRSPGRLARRRVSWQAVRRAGQELDPRRFRMFYEQNRRGAREHIRHAGGSASRRSPKCDKRYTARRAALLGIRRVPSPSALAAGWFPTQIPKDAFAITFGLDASIVRRSLTPSTSRFRARSGGASRSKRLHSAVSPGTGWRSRTSRIRSTSSIPSGMDWFGLHIAKLYITVGSLTGRPVDPVLSKTSTRPRRRRRPDADATQLSPRPQLRSVLAHGPVHMDYFFESKFGPNTSSTISTPRSRRGGRTRTRATTPAAHVCASASAGPHLDFITPSRSRWT